MGGNVNLRIRVSLNNDEFNAYKALQRRGYPASYIFMRGICKSLVKEKVFTKKDERMMMKAAESKAYDVLIKEKCRQIGFVKNALCNIKTMLAKCIDRKDILELVDIYIRKCRNGYRNRRYTNIFVLLKAHLSDDKIYKMYQVAAKEQTKEDMMTIIDSVFDRLGVRRS